MRVCADAEDPTTWGGVACGDALDAPDAPEVSGVAPPGREGGLATTAEARERKRARVRRRLRVADARGEGDTVATAGAGPAPVEVDTDRLEDLLEARARTTKKEDD